MSTQVKKKTSINLDNQTRKCSKCKSWKSFDSFWVDKNNTTGFFCRCIDCVNQERQSKEYKEYRSNYHQTEQYKKYHKEYEANKRVRTEKDNEARRKKEKRYRETNILYKLKMNCSRRIRLCINKYNNKTIDYLGCSIIDLKKHLESQFQPGMSWENYGLKGWHIDHIIPLASANTEEEIYGLFHYTNLQPLWAADNLKKSDKVLIKNG